LSKSEQHAFVETASGWVIKKRNLSAFAVQNLEPGQEMTTHTARHETILYEVMQEMAGSLSFPARP
jgi:hypothetical protein